MSSLLTLPRQFLAVSLMLCLISPATATCPDLGSAPEIPSKPISEILGQAPGIYGNFYSAEVLSTQVVSRQHLREVTQSFLSELNDEQTAGLYDYAIELIPNKIDSIESWDPATLLTRDVDPRLLKEDPRAARQLTRAREALRDFVPLSIATRTWEEVFPLFRKILGACHLIDLGLLSTPDGATVSLSTKSKGKHRETATNDKMRLYRGLYDYIIEKGGYKSGTGKLDLIEDKGDTFACQLALQNSSDSTICRLE